MNVTDIRKGNIVRSGSGERVPLYLGSGDFGGCFDRLGMQSHAFRSADAPETVFMHADYWHRGTYGLDYHMPLGRLAYQGLEPAAVETTSQVQDLYDGTLETQLHAKDFDLQVTAWFHPGQRDIFAMRLDYTARESGMLPEIIFQTDREVHAHYGQRVSAALRLLSQTDSCLWLGAEAGNAKAAVGLRVLDNGRQSTLRYVEDGERGGHAILTLKGLRGSATLLLCAGAFARREELERTLEAIGDARVWQAEASEAWHRRWGDKVPDLSDMPWNAQFLRSLYHLLASLSPADNTVAPPNGWTGNGWPFHFPQDFGFFHPALSKLGYLDIAKAKVEMYRRHLNTMAEYTKRVYGKDGVFWAWIFPIGGGSRILPEGAPNPCHYEIHNAVYPAKMAYETAQALRDPAWTRTVAWDIVRESARFFTSSLTKQEDGTWGIHVVPSMGQDEFGGADAQNYLCALYSARYTVALAVDMATRQAAPCAPEELARWKRILEEGFAFSRLENPRLGVYQTAEGQDFQLGRMKHPIELLPHGFLPMAERTVWEERAYELRYALCEGSKDNFFHGWSLVDILLCEARRGDRAAFERTYDRMLSATCTDGERIQIYESSKSEQAAYYVTNEGIFVLAVLEMAWKMSEGMNAS